MAKNYLLFHLIFHRQSFDQSLIGSVLTTHPLIVSFLQISHLKSFDQNWNPPIVQFFQSFHCHWEFLDQYWIGLIVQFRKIPCKIQHKVRILELR